MLSFSEQTYSDDVFGLCKDNPPIFRAGIHHFQNQIKGVALQFQKGGGGGGSNHILYLFRNSIKSCQISGQKMNKDFISKGRWLPLETTSGQIWIGIETSSCEVRTSQQYWLFSTPSALL